MRLENRACEPARSPKITSAYVKISRGKCRFVDEVHIPNAELRSSAELLSELQKGEGREPCLAQSKTGIQETGAAHVTSQTGIKETYADTLSVSPCQASFCIQRTIPTTERKWKVIPANSSYGRALPTAVSIMVTRLVRHYDQDERQPDAALHWDTLRPVLLKVFAKHGARDFSEKHWLQLIHQGSSKTRFEYCEDSKISLAYLRAIQGHSGGITVDPELMGHISDSLQLEVLSASNPSLRTVSYQGGEQARRTDHLLHTTQSFWWRFR